MCSNLLIPDTVSAVKDVPQELEHALLSSLHSTPWLLVGPQKLCSDRGKGEESGCAYLDFCDGGVVLHGISPLLHQVGCRQLLVGQGGDVLTCSSSYTDHQVLHHGAPLVSVWNEWTGRAGDSSEDPPLHLGFTAAPRAIWVPRYSRACLGDAGERDTSLPAREALCVEPKESSSRHGSYRLGAGQERDIYLEHL